MARLGNVHGQKWWLCLTPKNRSAHRQYSSPHPINRAQYSRLAFIDWHGFGGFATTPHSRDPFRQSSITVDKTFLRLKIGYELRLASENITHSQWLTLRDVAVSVNPDVLTASQEPDCRPRLPDIRLVRLSFDFMRQIHDIRLNNGTS